MKKLVTVAIPTFNRKRYLKQSINSVLNQTYKNLELLVVDNHSEDNTQKEVEGIHDSRIHYLRNKKNIGILSNWNKCIDLAKGKYLVILGDDDILLPTFIEESLKVHERYNVGFSFTHCNKVDKNGKFLMRWGYDFPPSGFLKGDKYLRLTVKYGACLTNSTTVMLNKNIFKTVGKFEAKYSTNTFDLNMWIKIADKFNLYFIDKTLAHYRVHKDQVSEIHWRRKMIHTGKIGTYLEIFDAIARLLQRRSYYGDKIKRGFLLGKLKEYDMKLTKLLTGTVPEL